MYLAPFIGWKRLFERDKRLEWVYHSLVGYKWVITKQYEPLKIKINDSVIENSTLKIRRTKAHVLTKINIKRLEYVYSLYKLYFVGHWWFSFSLRPSWALLKTLVKCWQCINPNDFYLSLKQFVKVHSIFTGLYKFYYKKYLKEDLFMWWPKQ